MANGKVAPRRDGGDGNLWHLSWLWRTFIGVSVFAQPIVFGQILVAAVAMDRSKVATVN